MSTTSSPGEEIAFAMVCLRTGMVLRWLSEGAREGAGMTDVANASPELFAVAQSVDWAGLFARFGSEGGKDFREIVLVSAECVRVMEKVPQERDVVLVAVAAGVQNVGFVLSGMRRRMLELTEARARARELDKVV